MRFRMYNYEVDKFMEFLLDLELKGKESRLRTRFIKLLAERSSLIQDEKQQLIEQFAKKDENGEFVVKVVEENQMYDIDDMDSFNLEYRIMMGEEYFVEAENEEKRVMMECVKDVVLNCDKAFSGNEALRFDRYCDIVESE